jgi:hypothetical protein
VAFVLLAGAGLLGLSLQRAMAVSPGFRPDHILTGQISLPWKTYPDGSARLAFTERLTREIGRQPGVLAAGVVSNLPFSGSIGKSAATVKGTSSGLANHRAGTTLMASGVITSVVVRKKKSRCYAASPTRRFRDASHRAAMSSQHGNQRAACVCRRWPAPPRRSMLAFRFWR